MEKIAEYKKGDIVPKEIEKLDPPSDKAKITFMCDVEVYKDERGYHIYPINELKEDGLILVDGGGEWGGKVVGAPMCVYTKPRNIMKRGTENEKNKTVHGLTLTELNNVPLSVLVSLHVVNGVDFHTSNGKIDGYFVK